MRPRQASLARRFEQLQGLGVEAELRTGATEVEQLDALFALTFRAFVAVADRRFELAARLLELAHHQQAARVHHAGARRVAGLAPALEVAERAFEMRPGAAPLVG